MQRTVAKTIRIEGIGLHRGALATLRIVPARANHGIVFKRTDINGIDTLIPARFDLVSDTRLNTCISNMHGASVSTIEHLMAALAGTGIGNALIEVDGPEIPILDGSSAIFVKEIWRAGIVSQDASVRVLDVTAPVRVEGKEGAYAALFPSAVPVMDYHIAFADTAVGLQSKSISLANGAFIRELSDCRTFCKLGEVEMMRQHGLALGGSLENAVVLDGTKVVNPGGFRREKESVRHKMLDALGDLALAGAPIMGRYVGYKSGHGLTNQLLREAVRMNALTLREARPAEYELLPGASLVNRDFERALAIVA